MQEEYEVIQNESEQESEKDIPRQESDRLLQTQLFVCLFLVAILYFAWRQGGPLWGDMSRGVRQILEEGISFSAQSELTRFTDEVKDFWGNLVEVWKPVY